MSTGIVVGRFQVDALTKSHMNLIMTARAQNDNVLVVVGGHNDVRLTPRNPLNFEAREQLIMGTFPSVDVAFLHDSHDDGIWSANLDALIFRYIQDRKEVASEVTLYGGRDSFLEVYQGIFENHVFHVSKWDDTATDRRGEIAQVGPVDSPEFRRGVIWASQHRWPVVYPTVDIAIVSPTWDSILLGRKKDESKWRLIGGFADPASSSFEEDAVREAKEEADVDIVGEVIYIGSFSVSDWRYEREIDQIRTTLFLGTADSEEVTPGDDIVEVCWFWLGQLINKTVPIVDDHEHMVWIAANWVHARTIELQDAAVFTLGPNYG